MQVNFTVYKTEKTWHIALFLLFIELLFYSYRFLLLFIHSEDMYVSIGLKSKYTKAVQEGCWLISI